MAKETFSTTCYIEVEKKNESYELPIPNARIKVFHSLLLAHHHHDPSPTNSHHTLKVFFFQFFFSSRSISSKFLLVFPSASLSSDVYSPHQTAFYALPRFNPSYTSRFRRAQQKPYIFFQSSLSFKVSITVPHARSKGYS